MLSQQTSRVRYTCDGITTDFDVPWYFFDDSELKVVMRSLTGVETVLTRNTDYFVIFNTDHTTGGKVIIGPPPSAGLVLAILRDVAALQSTDYIENDAFPASATEDALDKLTMLDTQWLDRWERSLVLMDTDGLANGQFQGGDNRISNIADPVLDNDVATKIWTLAQISAPAGWAPDKDTPQWNANRLQGRAVANVAPSDGFALKWSNANNRWEPQVAGDLSSALVTENTWQAPQHFDWPVYIASTSLNIGAPGGIVYSGDGGYFNGKFYGTPYGNRTLFKPNAANQPCHLGVVPNGAFESGYDCYGTQDPDNSPVLVMGASSSAVSLAAGVTGAASFVPFTISHPAGSSILFRNNGNIGVNGATDTGAGLSVNALISRNAAHFRVHRNAVVQSGVADSTFTKIAFTTEEIDQASMYDLANVRFKPTIPGKYMLIFACGTDVGGQTDTKRLELMIYKNGVVHRVGYNTYSAITGGAAGMGGQCAAIVDANGSTDYFEAYVWHNMGSAIGIAGIVTDTWFEGYHIG